MQKSEGRADEDERAGAAPIECEASSQWLVDGYNVLNAILLGGEDRSGWWREPARRRLIDRAERLPRECGQAWLVFDGDQPTPGPEPDAAGLRIVFTPSADDWIHQRVRRSAGPAPLVVTADRKLAKRCRRAGARIVSPGEFVAMCAVADADANCEAEPTPLPAADPPREP